MEEDVLCLICVYLIYLKPFVMGDVFDLITPKTVFDDVKLHKSDNDSDKWKYVVPNISEVKFPWIKYILCKFKTFHRNMLNIKKEE